MNLIDLWKIVRQSFHLFHVISTLLCDGKLCCPWKNCVTWSKEKKLIQTCALHSSQLSVAFRAPCERSCMCESASEMTWKYIACQFDIATDHNKSWNNNGPSTRLTIIEVSANANVDQRTNHCDSNTIARDFAFCSVCNEIDNEFEETLHATAKSKRQQHDTNDKIVLKRQRQRSNDCDYRLFSVGNFRPKINDRRLFFIISFCLMFCTRYRSVVLASFFTSVREINRSCNVRESARSR